MLVLAIILYLFSGVCVVAGLAGNLDYLNADSVMHQIYIRQKNAAWYIAGVISFGFASVLVGLHQINNSLRRAAGEN